MSQTARERVKIGIVPATAEGGMQGRTPRFNDYKEMALLAEQIGIDSFWLPDHLLYRTSEPLEEVGCWEALTILSAVAAVTTRITLGTLVACTSFRNPAMLAKIADTLDEVSAGRFVLGLGAGWHQPEYDAFGFPFDHRAARFEEALQIIVPLLREGHVDFQGQYYQVSDCVLRPRGPSPSGPRIHIGAGRPRMLQLTARYADGWNTAWHVDTQIVKQKVELLAQACNEVGRDPGSVEVTVGTIVRLTREGEPSEEGEKAIAGSPREIANQLQSFADAGASQVLVVLDPMSPVGIERFHSVVEALHG